MQPLLKWSSRQQKQKLHQSFSRRTSGRGHDCRTFCDVTESFGHPIAQQGLLLKSWSYKLLTN